jgi:hypothetical protein
MMDLSTRLVVYEKVRKQINLFFFNSGLLMGPKFLTIEKMSARLQNGMRNSFLGKGINAK